MLALEELKDWLKVEGDDDDTALRALEQRAVAFLEAETGRYLRAAAETTVYVSGRGTRELHLPDPPAAEAEIVQVVERAYPGDTGTTITAADDDGFVVRSASLVRKGGYRWQRGYEYEVTYERGYAADASEPDYLTDAPEVARQAVLDLVALKWRGRGSEALRSETIGGYSYTRGALEELPGLEDAIRQLRLDWL